MSSTHSWLRAIGVLSLIPISFAIAVATQNIQTILLFVAIFYTTIASGYLWRISRNSNTSVKETLELKDFLLRRGSAWGLILYVMIITLLITQSFFMGFITVLIVYVGGVFDRVSLREKAKEIQPYTGSSG